MLELEKDSYYEAHMGAPAGVMFIIWLGWVAVTYIGFVGGEFLAQSIQSVLIAPDPTNVRLLSLEEVVTSSGVWGYVVSLVGAVVAGTVLGFAQGLFLWPFLKAVGMLEWIVATFLGRTVRWIAVYVVSREFVRLTIDKHALGICYLFLMLVGVALLAGVAVGKAQSIVLDRRVHHSSWWTLANIPGPVAASIFLTMTLYAETQNTLRDLTTPLIAIITGVVTGIALLELLKHPSLQAEWLSKLHWRQEQPASPQPDTVLGSTLYGTRPTRPVQHQAAESNVSKQNTTD